MNFKIKLKPILNWFLNFKLTKKWRSGKKEQHYYLKMKGLHYNYLKELYLNVMYRFGIPADYKLLDDSIIHGIINGIDDSGKLLIISNDTVKHFDFREISFLI